MHIGRRIHIERSLKGYTLSSLAQGITSKSYLSKLENGDAVPSEEILQSLAERLHLPSDFILCHDQEDSQLWSMLKQLFYYSIMDIGKTESIIELIESDYYFNLRSPQQEFYYLVLKNLVLIKKKQTEELENVHHRYLVPYLEGVEIESLPTEIQRAVYCYFGYYHFSQLHYKKSLDNLSRLYEIIDNQDIKAAIIYNISILYKRMGQFQDAIIAAKKAIEHYKQIDSTYYLALCFNSVGDLYREKKLNKEALVEFENAKKLAEEHSYKNILSYTYHNIGLISKESGDHEKASTYFYKALHQKMEKDSLLITYRELISCKLNERKIEEARQLYDTAKLLTDKEEDYKKLAFNFTEYYYINKEFEHYEKELNALVLYFEKTNNVKFLVICYKKLAAFYFQLGKFKKSAILYDKAFDIIES
ncbi:helix-turn-helix domain-containing protein [Aquibacillus koreensis]|uniref:Helix-turn-helix domain-containing protein n=1 Tax=Aquibacillus koreensis TaxID=279446 RepID=A0A9X4ALN3_9BACI|nr:helix-turn-helix domain-containing protein [Aquibacillus koreensis]MCT2536667.1 helix-turn-helix domain-containing protein [Aquibacillus koreensis]MDC3422620.1 helix-turn-helix domain-containing protein [Aquibacillus koreensis]